MPIGSIGASEIMDSLPTWARWLVAAGVLLSPVVAFLLALVAEILIGIVKEGGAPALLVLVCTGLVSLWCRKRLAHQRTASFAADQG